MPILPGTDGVRRMGKSLGNYVGVTDAPEDMFGKLMSVPDGAMGQYYRLLLGAELDPDRHPGEAKRELARRLVERFHGADAAAAAEARFDQLHVRREVPDDVEEALVEAGGPNGSVHLPALLAEHFGLSRSEARRLIDQGGVRIGGKVLEAGRLDVPGSELDGEVLQVGKRRHKRLRVGGTGLTSPGHPAPVDILSGRLRGGSCLPGESLRAGTKRSLKTEQRASRRTKS